MIDTIIARELAVNKSQVSAAINLLDEGATVPFIARYRKELTGGLDDTQLRKLDERLRYLRDLEDRKQTVLKSIREQGQLTPALEQAIVSCQARNVLEDLYLPYKPKRTTKGQIAREAGLEPLANALLENPLLDPEQEALKYLADKGVSDVSAALDGARYILMERFSEDAVLINAIREYMQEHASVISQLVEGKEQDAEKFRDYFDFAEPYKKVPSHRALAMFRGRKEGFLQVRLDVPQDDLASEHPCEVMIARHIGIEDAGRGADAWLKKVVKWTWRVKLHTHVETDLMTSLRERAEQEAIKVFADNLKDLLLAAPAGPKATIGLDPGLRTGVKLAVVDHTGKLLEHCTIYPNPPRNNLEESAAVLTGLVKKHGVKLIAIGNGTASRETEKFVADVIKTMAPGDLKQVMVNEAGASVYSASEYAAREFPDLDVSIRGAVSIARRLQDPLAELVKIEPKSIGVGQYQHDVSQANLARSLDAVVEDCVNAVGVDVNMASSALLGRVSGLSQRLANNIVEHRDTCGVFKNRECLKQVAQFGDKTFEQAAGFLRVNNGDNVLDASSVHPESYHIVEQIAREHTVPVKDMIGDSHFLDKLDLKTFITDTTGLPTLRDIIEELKKPGRDPRPEFRTAHFKDGVETLNDLEPGMVLEGAVTNVTNFGAFVDIGVHQDGLVHISAMSHEFVSDPRKLARAGDIVRVKIMSVDAKRKRIGLSMRLDDEPVTADNSATAATANKSHGNKSLGKGSREKTGRPGSGSVTSNTMAEAFANALIK